MSRQIFTTINIVINKASVRLIAICREPVDWWSQGPASLAIYVGKSARPYYNTEASEGAFLLTFNSAKHKHDSN